MADTLLGTADLNGSGNLQTVYLVGNNQIKVSGRTDPYTLGSATELVANVVLLGMEEINNVLGKEIVLSATVNDIYHVVYVINDKSHTYTKYDVAGSWVPPEARLEDFNGDGAKDLLLNVTGQNGLHEYRIRHFAASSYETTYNFSNNIPSTIFLVGGITDTDGVLGTEIVVNAGSSIAIIHDKTSSTRKYIIGTDLWTSFGLSDLDGVSGNEIALRHGNHVEVINDSKGTQWSSEYVAGNFVFSSFQNMDSKGGNEIIVSIVATSELKTIYYSTGSSSASSIASVSSISSSKSSSSISSSKGSSSSNSSTSLASSSSSRISSTSRSSSSTSSNTSSSESSSSESSSDISWLIPILNFILLD